MTERPPITETLKRTSRRLKTIQKDVAADGYIDELRDIDSLVGIAKIQADRKLSEIQSKDDEIRPTGKAHY